MDDGYDYYVVMMLGGYIIYIVSIVMEMVDAVGAFYM